MIILNTLKILKIGTPEIIIVLQLEQLDFTVQYCVQKICIVVLLFYVHGKQLRSCRDGQLT